MLCSDILLQIAFSSTPRPVVMWHAGEADPMVTYCARVRANLRLKAAPKASNPNSPISGIGLAVFGS